MLQQKEYYSLLLSWNEKTYAHLQIWNGTLNFHSKKFETFLTVGNYAQIYRAKTWLLRGFIPKVVMNCVVSELKVQIGSYRSPDLSHQHDMFAHQTHRPKYLPSLTCLVSVTSRHCLSRSAQKAGLHSAPAHMIRRDAPANERAALSAHKLYDNWWTDKRSYLKNTLKAAFGDHYLENMTLLSLTQHYFDTESPELNWTPAHRSIKVKKRKIEYIGYVLSGQSTLCTYNAG